VFLAFTSSLYLVAGYIIFGSSLYVVMGVTAVLSEAERAVVEILRERGGKSAAREIGLDRGP
jgi:hypothetical protein